MPERDPSVITAYNNLGCVFTKSSKLSEGKEALERAWQLSQDNSFVRDSSRCMIMINRGDLWRRAGDLDKAESELIKALTVSGAADDWTRAALDAALGRLYAQQQNFEEAERWFAEGVQLLEKLGGCDHPKLIPVLVDFAQVLQAAGYSDKASATIERADAIIHAHNLDPAHFGR